jgi:hypothetical protein
VTPAGIIARLRGVQRRLQLLAIGSVLLWVLSAVAVALLVSVVVRVVNGVSAPIVTAFTSVLAAAVVGAWRWRVIAPDRIAMTDAALLAESHAVALRYSLVTLAEQPVADDSDRTQRRLAAYAATTGWEKPTSAAITRHGTSLAMRMLVAGVALALGMYPWPSRTSAARTVADANGDRPVRVAPKGRVQATATLMQPAYAGRAPQRIAFGATVSALVGSVLRIAGVGPDSMVRVAVQEASPEATSAPRALTLSALGNEWLGVVRVGTVPLAVRLTDPVGERWILITPVVDSAPIAALVLPATDTLLYDTTAVLRVSGSVHDDIGLHDARIEYIISSGSGEQFTFTSGVLADARKLSTRDHPIAALIDVAKLGLKPGDLMHVRITAHDANAVAGPSLGSSETRTIRLPRRDERDSVAIEQLPPTPVDTSALSQRQLLMLTERLVARLPRINRTTMVAESQRLGLTQARLRKQVADIVFARLGNTPSGEHAHFPGDGHNHSEAELATLTTPESVLKAADRATGGVSGMLDTHGDETPVVAVNRPLLEAYNAMWDASRALQGGEPRQALDPMRRALAAIQRARTAERVYLRGTPPAAVVDVAKIRLIGTDTARFEARRALEALPEPQRRIGERVLRGLALLTARDVNALDSLRLARLDALGVLPTLAAALGDVTDAVERGRDATAAVLRARRIALSPWQPTAGSALWIGGAP